ncbi:hypothetical protein ACA910_008172 [Epithemia clementina (nom. ined.)]
MHRKFVLKSRRRTNEGTHSLALYSHATRRRLYAQRNDFGMGKGQVPYEVQRLTWYALAQSLDVASAVAERMETNYGNTDISYQLISSVNVLESDEQPPADKLPPTVAQTYPALL